MTVFLRKNDVGQHSPFPSSGIIACLAHFKSDLVERVGLVLTFSFHGRNLA